MTRSRGVRMVPPGKGPAAKGNRDEQGRCRGTAVAGAGSARPDCSSWRSPPPRAWCRCSAPRPAARRRPSRRRRTPTSCCSSPPTACARTRSRSTPTRASCPASATCCATARKASGNGLLTQAPPNTGAGWFTLATGAWPGVAGSTNNTFHVNGQPFGNRTSALGTPACCRPRRSPSRPSAAARRSPRSSGRAAAAARSTGPTLDFRNFRSGRGVATNYIAPTDYAAFTAAFGLQFDHPRRLRRPRAVPAGRADGRDRLDRRAHVLQPGARRCACACSTAEIATAVDKYGLNAYIYDSRNDGRTRYDRVLFSPTKDGDDAVGNLREGEWADVKVKIQGSDLDGKTGALLVKVERLAGDLSQVRLFHTSVTRAIATWPTWPGEPGFTGTFEDFVAERFPSSQAGDFAVLEAGIVSEETYIEQGAYWETAYHPLIKYVLDTYKPDLALVGYPVTDEVQHQFLGLVTKKLPNGAPQPGLRRRRGQRHAGRPREASARRSSATPTRAPTRRCAWPRSACATAT